jgi:hypothetical protein
MGEWMYKSMFFFTSALTGGEWSASRPGRSTPRDRAPGTHWIGGWVGPSASLTTWRKFLTLPWLELRPLGRQVRSQSLSLYAWNMKLYVWLNRVQLCYTICIRNTIRTVYIFIAPVTVAERSRACTRTLFARSEVAIVSSNPTQGMDV